MYGVTTERRRTVTDPSVQLFSATFGTFTRNGCLKVIRVAPEINTLHPQDFSYIVVPSVLVKT